MLVFITMDILHVPACCPIIVPFIMVVMVVTLAVYMLYRRRRQPYMKCNRGLAVVMVLGDIGHSPRMQYVVVLICSSLSSIRYHSISLAEQADMDVIILGYPG